VWTLALRHGHDPQLLELQRILHPRIVRRTGQETGEHYDDFVDWPAGEALDNVAYAFARLVACRTTSGCDGGMMPVTTGNGSSTARSGSGADHAGLMTMAHTRELHARLQRPTAPATTASAAATGLPSPGPVHRARDPAPGPFVFQHPPWRTAEPEDQGHYRFDQVTAMNADFTLDHLAWDSCRSTCIRCVFRQAGKPTNPTPGYSGAEGSLATAPRSTGTAPSTMSTSVVAAVDSCWERRALSAAPSATAATGGSGQATPTSSTAPSSG
jgi:hypothetical protein